MEPAVLAGGGGDRHVAPSSAGCRGCAPARDTPWITHFDAAPRTEPTGDFPTRRKPQKGLSDLIVSDAEYANSDAASAPFAAA
ncbi:MAG: hypothetical protein Kow00133_15910 [Amphiplicatus sp.]